MAGPSNIEWCTDTWNPIVGCSIVSPGCTNCYAMKMAARLESMRAGWRDDEDHYRGTTKRVNGSAVWTGKVVVAPESILLAPLRWKHSRRIFVNSMGDLFHESIPDEMIDRIFAVMALCPKHTFQVLTKRAERMREYCGDLRVGAWRKAMRLIAPDQEPSLITDPLPNVWLGISAERQQEADERIPLLLQTPAAIRFVSAEPLLGPINLTRMKLGGGWYDVLGGWRDVRERFPGFENTLDWVIVGGESGANARKFDLAWARSIVDQCRKADVRCFVKQLGSNPSIKRFDENCTSQDTGVAVHLAYRDRKGGDWSEWPNDLRIREFPNTLSAPAETRAGVPATLMGDANEAGLAPVREESK